MFIGPIEADKPWDVSAVAGVYRFLHRVYSVVEEMLSNDLVGSVEQLGEMALPVRRKLHQTIKKVTQDVPALKFNTSIAAMMEWMNVWEPAVRAAVEAKASGQISGPLLTQQELVAVVKLLAPLAPFMAEELYHQVMGVKPDAESSVHLSDWPAWDEMVAAEESVKLAVQVNGKVRAEIKVSVEDSQDESAVLAAARAAVSGWLAGQQLVKELYVSGRLVSLVVK
jgi:leucyl-tRNA synthetase